MINNVFAGVDGMYLLELMCQARKLKSLCLSGTQLADKALYNFSGSSLEMLDVSDTMVSYYIWTVAFNEATIYFCVYQIRENCLIINIQVSTSLNLKI